MVLEEFLNKLGKRKFYSFFLGLLYVFIGYGTASIFFPQNISLTMIFFITLLLVPSAIKLISLEEDKEGRYGVKKFVKNHKVIIEVLLFLFIGVFLGYFILGFTGGYENVISYQQNFLENQGINETLIDNFLQTDQSKLNKFAGIAISNMGVSIIAFVLSFFYGIGAIFLIVLNASIFSTFILFVTQQLGKSLQEILTILGIFSIYAIPEVAGFLLAAIAGGVISKAVIKEKVGSKRFKNVVKDATLLLLVSFAVILLSALLEVFVTGPLIRVLF
ncbi:stage II sporulation protein M [Nanoarchaeota archaeon]